MFFSMEIILIYFSFAAIIYSIMKGSNRISSTLKDFRILFSPRSIIFFKKNALNLKIYLQKHVQVIGTVKEFIPPLAANINYIFSEFNDPIEFRVVNEKTSNYIISIYEVQSSGEERLLESSELKFSKFLEDYYKQFLSLEAQLFQELKERQVRQMGEIWRQLSKGFTKKNYISGVRLHSIEAIIEYVIEPVHSYDDEVSDYEEREKKKVRKMKPEDVLKRQFAIPDYLPMDKQNQYFRRDTKDDELTIIAPVQFKSGKKEVLLGEDSKVKSKVFSPVFQLSKDHVLSNIPEVSETGFSNRENQRSLQTQSKKLHPKSNIIQNVTQENQVQDKVVDISIRRDLLGPEIKTSTKFSVLQLQSILKDHNHQNTTIFKGQNICIVAILIVSVALIAILMHPLSKIR